MDDYCIRGYAGANKTERIVTIRLAAKNDGNTGLARCMRCTTFIRLMVRCIAGKKIFEECESERACNGTLDVLPQHVDEGASATCNCA